MSYPRLYENLDVMCRIACAHMCMGVCVYLCVCERPYICETQRLAL